MTPPKPASPDEEPRSVFADEFKQVKHNVTRLRPRSVQLESQGPDQLLQDMRLDHDLCERLQEPLQGLGYTLEEDEVVDPFTGRQRRRVSVLRGGHLIWYFLEISPLLLNDVSQPNLERFGYLEHMFPQECQLRILSPHLSSPRLPYDTMTRGWKDRNRFVKFVNWTWLEDVLESDDIFLERLADVLGIPVEEQALPTAVIVVSTTDHGPGGGTEPSPQPVSASQPGGPSDGGPTDEEFKRVARLLANEADIAGGPSFFDNLIRQLAVPNEWGAPAHAEGNYDTAFNLVNWSHRKGTYPKGHEYWNSKALGMVIFHLYNRSGQEVRDKLLETLSRNRSLLQESHHEMLANPEQKQ